VRNTSGISRSPPLVVAHRGACRYAPDNSVGAVELAILQGADMVEIDIRCTADGVLVTHHDEMIGGMPLRVLSYDLVRRAVPGIATFDQVLKVASGRVMLDLEIKEDGYEKAVLEMIDEHSVPLRDVLVTSFVPQVVRRVKGINPLVETGWIVSSAYRGDPLSRLGMTGADWLVAEHTCLTSHLIDSLEARRISLAVWTVNLWSEIAAAFRVPGLGALITDLPDVARSLRHRYAHEWMRRPAMHSASGRVTDC
jgi:glycerophosphoryl diester phosphodiesterase